MPHSEGPTFPERRADDRSLVEAQPTYGPLNASAGPLGEDALHRLLLESVRDYAIFAVSPDGRVATWNPGAERLKGYAAAEVVGKPIATFYPPEARDADGSAPQAEALLRAAAQHGRAEVEAWRVRKDGARFWAHVVITPVRDEQGTLVGFAKVTHDVTARRAAEERARELAAEQAARAVAERAEAETRHLAEQLQEQAAELESQTEEAQCLAEELEQSNEQLQQTTVEAEEARDAAERAWRQADELQARYRRLFEASPLPSWTVDLETLAVLDVNEAAVRRYGWTREEFGALTLRDLRDPSSLRDLEVHIAQVVAEGRFQGIVAHRTKAGERLDVDMSVRRIVHDGRSAMVAVLTDVTARLRAEARQRFLVQATELLGDSLDYEATLTRIVRLAVPTLADWAAYNVADGEYVRTVALHHPDPAMARLAREIEDRYPQRLDSGAAVAKVLTTGEAELIPEIPDALLRMVARDDEHYEQLRSIGFRSLINVPLVARGHVLGALGFATGDSGRLFTEEDLAFARELGRRAGLALDNALHFRAEQEARARAEVGVERLERLRRLAASISGSVDVDTVSRVVARETRAALAADAVYVARLLPEEGVLELVHGEGFPLALEAARARFALDMPVPGAEVARTGQALWIASHAEREARFGRFERTPIAQAFAASATVPLLVDGAPVGSIGVYFREARTFGDDERAFLGALAEQVALTLERVRLFEAEQRAHAAAAAAQARAEFLSEASRLLASSLDYTVTLQSLARAAVPRLGDWCAVDMVVDPASGAWPPEVRRLAVMHQDPAKIAWAHELQRRLPTDWSANSGLARVLREGATEFLPVIDDALLVAVAKSPEQLALLRDVGFSAYLCVPLQARGRVVGAITLCMTESKRHYDPADRALAEELAHRASLAIEHAELYREAQQANAAKAQFLATMSHELRTPLNAIGGYVDLLSMGIRGPVTEEQLADLSRVRRSQRHLLSLINDVLDFARIEAGQTQYRIEEVRLAEVLDAVVTLVTPLADAKGHTLALDACDRALAARADREKVEQVLVNLLSNAIKFTADGGRIAVECTAHGPRLEVRVTDTGIGIPADRLPSIFEPFVQVQTGLTRNVGGSGLGLAISRDLARGMGGELTAESTPGEGSTFTLTLPAA